jgi:hypothetical protein
LGCWLLLHFIAERGRLIQPNFHTISRRCRLHRSICQRVIRDFLVSLGIHIVAGHQLKVCQSLIAIHFPSGT